MNSAPPPSRSPSTSASRTRSSDRSNVPFGIYVIVGLGLIGALLGIVGALGIIGHGYGLLGIVALSLAVAEAVVLVGLLRLKAWAWLGALFLQGLGVLLDALRVDLLGVVISVVIIAYLISVADVFE